MDGPNQPSKLHLRHDELNALEREIFTPFVVEQEQDTRHNLNDEQEERDASEVVPDGVTVDGNTLLAEKVHKVAELNALINPIVKTFPVGFHACFEMKTSSP